MSELRAIIPCKHGETGRCDSYLIGIKDDLPVAARPRWKKCEGGREIRLQKTGPMDLVIVGAHPNEKWRRYNDYETPIKVWVEVTDDE